MACGPSKRVRRGLTALFAALCLPLSACSLALHAPGSEAGPLPTPTPPPSELLTLPAPDLDKPSGESRYPDVRVYIDGLLTGRGYLVEDEVYLSPEEICGFYDVELTVDLEAGAVVSPQGLNMQMPEGAEYMIANGRYLYTPHGPVTADDRLYLPADAVQRVFGLQIQVEEEPLRAEISGEKIAFLEGGAYYYDYNYSTEDLFWLTHIIHAEAQGEPLGGMIGVGNVVMNRVESEYFPNNVFDVIFDRNGAVQFSPITSGRIYDSPTLLSYIAAYLVLEGYNTVGESMFFVNPDIGDDSWFEARLCPVAVIGQHHFYAANSPEDLEEAEQHA